MRITYATKWHAYHLCYEVACAEKRFEMSYDTLMIANFFVNLSSIKHAPITPMKLQKLVFFAHGWYLAITGKPLIADKIEAWQYGTFIPSVYDHFKGNKLITEPAKVIKQVKGKIVLYIPELPTGEDHQFVRDLLQRVWNIYKSYSAIQLSNMTHALDSPWAKTIEPYREKSLFPYHLEISQEVIRDYFVDKSARK